MKENLERMFKNKKTENLIFFLIVLIVTLIVINQILKDDKNSVVQNTINTAVLASSDSYEETENLSEKLEKILKKIRGVGNVSVLVTYSESEVTKVPMYNENNTVSSTEEVDKSGGTKKSESETNQKEVVMGSDQNPIIQTIEKPKIEGAIITAEGVSNIDVKSNIISAVEAATGLPTHKIQVFEMAK